MVSEQCRFFLMAVLYGFGACFEYDLLRMLRRIVPHSLLFIHGEDLVFWTGTVLLFYYGVLKLADGVLRSYYFWGLLLAVVIYEGAISPVLLKIAVKSGRAGRNHIRRIREDCKRTEKKFGNRKKTIDG